MKELKGFLFAVLLCFLLLLIFITTHSPDEFCKRVNSQEVVST